MSQNKYWLHEPSTKVVETMENFRGRFSSREKGTNPIRQAWVRNLAAYYSNVLDPQEYATSLSFEGEQGELVKMLVPQGRKLIRELVNLVTKNRLHFQALAKMNNQNAVRSTRICNPLTAEITQYTGLDKKSEDCLEDGLVLGTGFMSSIWRTDRGDEYTAEDGRMLYKGKVHIRRHTSFDVTYDYSIEDWSEVPYVELCVTANRWDLIAKYPELRDYILALPSVHDDSTSSFYADFSSAELTGDMIRVYELYVRPCPSIPKGRMCFYSDPNTVYYDGPNRYGCIPVEQMKLMPIKDMGYGYPLFSDLLPAQEMLDHSFSAIATNQSAFAVQNILAPRSSNIGPVQLMGMNFIEYDPDERGGGKPEALQLAKSAPETFKFAEQMVNHLELLSGVNAALRGSPPPGVTSGVAIATLTTNALEFIASGMKDYAFLNEKIMTHSINAYKKFAEVEQVVAVTGSNKKSFEKTFVGEDLEPITGVKILLQNAKMQTTSGRTEVAELLIKAGIVKRPQQFISVLEGAPLEELYETELSEEDLINSENQALIESVEEPVPVLQTDDHAAHIRDHSALLNEMEVRRDPKLAARIMDHILEHRAQANTIDPMLEAMLRTGMKPQMPPGPGGPGGGAELPPLPGGEGEGVPGEAQSAEPANDALERV